MFPPYSVHALRWEQFSSTAGPATSSPETATSPAASDDATIGAIQENLRQALNRKKWLLEEDQHLEVPPTHLDDHTGRIFSVGDFLKRVDEARELDVQQCAVDEHGNRRLLKPEQFHQLKQTGELTVPSELFENQYHTWKVKPAFYSGRQTVSDALGEGVGKALSHYVVYTNDAIASKDETRFHPTLQKALVNGFLKAGKKLREASGQLFAGRLQHPTYSDGCIDYVLQNAERSYVSYHLREQGTVCLLDPVNVTLPIYGDGEETSGYWSILENEGYVDFVNKYRPSFQDREKQVEDREALVSMRQNFQDRLQRKKRVQLNVNQERSLKDPQSALKGIHRAEVEWRENSEKEWINHLRNIADNRLQELGQLEADRLEAIRVEMEVEREDLEVVELQLDEYKIALKKKNRILYLSKGWRNHKLEAKRQKLNASIESTRFERVVKRLDEKGFIAQSAARKLALEFHEEFVEPLIQQLQSKMSAFPPATFKVLQLDPNHWTFHGSGSINRYKKVEVDLGKPFWRLRYTSVMATMLMKGMVGGAFHFLVSGPLSLRALFSPRPFYAVERPARDERSITQTLISRLRSFYATLRDVRASFDASPDTGLIGKSIQSFFLRVYLAVKGAVGTVAITTFMTVGTMLATSLGLVVLTLAPILAGAITLATALFNLFIYDTAIASAKRACFSEDEMPSCIGPVLKIGIAIPYYLIVPGAIQATLAVARIAIVHPLVGACTLGWASFRYLLRSLRDSLTWLLIAKYSRIPASDSFLAWRIHGPGLAPKEYYRLPLNAAKTGVLLLLDKYRLCAHAEVRRSEINAPYDQYSELFKHLVNSFGVNASLQIPSTSSLAFEIGWKSQVRRSASSRLAKHPSFMSRNSEHPLDIWDTVADGIRRSHPLFEEAQERNILGQRAAPEFAGDSVSGEQLISGGQSELESLRKTELGELVRRSGTLLAEWDFKISQQNRRLSRAMSIPTRYQGRFRMSEAELQNLWEFTLSAVELYGHQIKEELQEVLETSEFSADIRQSVVHATDSFYTRSGARPGQDIAVVAAFLLRTLLGGFDMLETLESADERMVLNPKLADEDEHLVFWKSISECIDIDCSWVMPWPE